MSAQTDPAVAAINDARALLDTLLGSDWREIHVVSGETEIFIARNGAGANPMRAAPAAPIADPARSLPPAVEKTVTAPHVATVVEAVSVGTRVEAGQTVATLHVLDEPIAVTAPGAGTVVRVDAAPGELLDFGAPLVTIGQAA